MVDLIISMVLSMGRVPGAIWLTFCMHTGKICEKFWPGMIVSFVQCSTILRILMSVFTMRKCIYLEALVGIANLLCACAKHGNDVSLSTVALYRKLDYSQVTAS